MYSKVFVPSLLENSQHKILNNSAAVIAGVALLTLLAQLKIVLPWTPVPITGQTMGVTLLALNWGSRLSLASFAAYLCIGFLGAPVFAGGLSGVLVGPTFGYLIGMLIASWVVGRLSEKGFNHTFKKSLIACYAGSFITFTCGVIGLLFFIPTDKLLVAGVIPFLPGDLLKNIISSVVTKKLTFKN